MNAATSWLNEDAAKNSAYYLKRNGTILEEDVIKSMIAHAENTPFKGTIERVSGQKFPDIVAGGYFGVEVKSSKDKWTSISGSVNESTRVKGIE